MTILTWAIRIVILIFLVVFATQNTEPVTLRLFATYQWQAPLVVILLVAVLLGGLLGVTALLGKLYRQHRLIRKLSRASAQAPTPVALPPEPPAL